MPKETEKGLLAKAVRNGKTMLAVTKDAYESGNMARLEAALQLAEEFIADLKEVVVPLINANRVAHESATQPAPEVSQ